MSSGITPDNLEYGSQRLQPTRGKPEFNNLDRRAGVTTNIEANLHDDEDEIALDTIAVKTHQVQEVEVRSNTSQLTDLDYTQRQGSEDAIVKH